MKLGGSKLIRSFRLPRVVNNTTISFTVEIFLCEDILSRAPLSKYNFLVNPANESLVGTRQPYFPVGGPVPPELLDTSALASSRWGGMDAGENMMYPVEVVDGEVHAVAGHGLLSFLLALPVQYHIRDRKIRCPVGTAIKSPAFGLSTYFTNIIHVVPPFYLNPDWENSLRRAYLNSFMLSLDGVATDSSSDEVSVATVLLGSGCRGIPASDAVRIASQAVGDFNTHLLTTTTTTRPTTGTAANDDDARTLSANKKLLLHFCLRESEHCELLEQELSRVIGTLND